MGCRRLDGLTYKRNAHEQRLVLAEQRTGIVADASSTPVRSRGRAGGGCVQSPRPGQGAQAKPALSAEACQCRRFVAVTGMLPTGDVTRFGRGFRREEMSCAERAGERDKPAASGNSLRRGPQSGRSKARPRDSSNRLGMAGRMERFRSRRSVVRREITLRAGSAASWLLPLPCYEVWQARPFHLA